MFARPKAGEDEDEILKLQEEFLRNKQASSTSVINKRKSDEKETNSGSTQDGSSKKPRSKFASRRQGTKSQEDKTSRNVVGPDILGDIKEKNMTNVFAPPPKALSRQGFPEPFVRDKTLIGKDKSIFAQQVAKMKESDSSKEMEVDSVDTDKQRVGAEASCQFGERSFVLSGPESQKIHEENIQKLSRMAAEEILKEQQKLSSQLDPKLLQFLRSRRRGSSLSTGVDEGAKQQPIEDSDSMTMDTDVRVSNTLNLDSVNSKKLDSSQVQCTSDISQQVDKTRIVNMETESIKLSGAQSCDVNSDASNQRDIESNTEIPDLLIKSDEANKWLHMDTVEHEKLQWIGDIPPPPAIPADSPYSARFDFQGLLLPYADNKIDVTKALHHHGEEPERPGYTLQELLQLSRSSVLQQRVLALTTIANILDKTKAGYYDECLETPLLNQLVDSELYLLLRFSLDDNTETMVTASLLALRNLLWNQPDELCLDRLLGVWNGQYQPSLPVKTEVTKPSEKEELKEDEAEMKDHQILKLDTVKGALRTDLMLRLRYILEVLRPGPKAVINILEILIRIVRHSHDSALAVTCCPRLMSIIIANFIPRDWGGIVGSSKPSEMASVYGVPLVEALKLLRVIASCSRSMASDLVHKFGLMDSLLSYVSIDPRECGLPQQEAVRLSLESFYLWNTLMVYNFATTHFIDLYPIIMRLFQFHLSATSAADISSTFGHEHGAAVLSLLKEAILVADAQMKRAASQKVANISQRIAVTLSYENLSGFSHPLDLCLKKWLNQLSRAEEITFSSMKLVAAALNCSAIRYTKLHAQPGINSVSMLEEIEDVMRSSVQPFLSSANFKITICGKLKSSSCLLSKKRSGKDRDPMSLPSLGSLVWGGREVMPSICPNSPLVLLQSLAHFLTVVCSIHRGIQLQSVHSFLDNPHILDYISLLGSRKLEALDNWFTRVETAMLVAMLKFLQVVLPAADFQHVGLFHNLALRLVAVIPADQKFLAKEVFVHAVFNPDFLRDCSDLTYSLESLKLSDVAPEQERTSIHSLLEKATTRVQVLWQCYQSALGLSAVCEPCILDISTQTCGENGSEPAFPNDWSYLPILTLYTQALSGKGDSADNIGSVVSSLQWLLVVECLRPQAMSTISVTARFCRLSTVFLAGSDLFLDPGVHNHLDALLRILLRSNCLLDFNEKIPGLTSFYDLYTQLVEQFAAVSYGDELFGHFVLVPLQQRHSPSYRKLVWSEHAAILRVLRTRPEQLAFPFQEYLEPCETEPSLLMTYLRALATGQVRQTWCPVLYRVALHHVATFISKEPDTSIAKQLTARIHQLGNKELQAELLSGGTSIS